MKEVFISYSTIDVAAAETVCHVLEKNGFSCWMAPRDIPGGSNYTKEIPIAIRNCKVFVIILSRSAQNSQWVLKELDSAVNCGKVILPFMLEDCTLNDEFNFLLTGAQRYAAYQKKSEAMEILIGRIRGILDVPCPPAAESEEPPAEPVPPKQEAPKQPAPQKAAPIYWSDAACPACGGSELTELPKRLKRQGLFELATMLLIPLLGVVCGFLLALIAVLAMPSSAYNVILYLMLAGLILGGVWGNYISGQMVRRHRLRQRIRSVCYRCSRCSKIFRYDEPLENK